MVLILTFKVEHSCMERERERERERGRERETHFLSLYMAIEILDDIHTLC